MVVVVVGLVGLVVGGARVVVVVVVGVVFETARVVVVVGGRVRRVGVVRRFGRVVVVASSVASVGSASGGVVVVGAFVVVRSVTGRGFVVGETTATKAMSRWLTAEFE